MLKLIGGFVLGIALGSRIPVNFQAPWIRVVVAACCVGILIGADVSNEGVPRSQGNDAQIN